LKDRAAGHRVSTIAIGFGEEIRRHVHFSDTCITCVMFLPALVLISKTMKGF
jgi:hypothetical protein